MAEEKQTANRKQEGVDAAEGAAWLGGGVAGAALGAMAGPVGAAAGAVAGGALADEGVENAQGENRGQRGNQAQAGNRQGK